MKTTSKIFATLLVTASLLMVQSCTETITEDEYRAEMINLIETNETEQDSLQDVYLTTLDEIDMNLDMIRDREGLIMVSSKSNSDIRISKKEQILNNISMINSLLAENHKKIISLQKNVVAYKKSKKVWIRTINQAKDRMQVQENKINELKNCLEESEFKIAELNKKLDEKTFLAQMLNEKSAGLDKELNRVYFASGTYKELKANHILTKEGGIFGMGRVKTLNQNLDKNQFVELNQKENTTLLLNGKNPKVITKHPASSYTLSNSQNDLAKLTINDPTTFWSASKYLVVQMD